MYRYIKEYKGAKGAIGTKGTIAQTVHLRVRYSYFEKQCYSYTQLYPMCAVSLIGFHGLLQPRRPQECTRLFRALCAPWRLARIATP